MPTNLSEVISAPVIGQGEDRHIFILVDQETPLSSDRDLEIYLKVSNYILEKKKKNPKKRTA